MIKLGIGDVYEAWNMRKSKRHDGDKQLAMRREEEEKGDVDRRCDEGDEEVR